MITTAGAASQDAASIPTPEARIAAAAALMGGPAQELPADVSPAQKPPTAPAPDQTPLAEVIRAQREARQARDREVQRATGLEAELKAARAELAAAKADRAAFEDDPVGYAKARSWTPEQQLLYGQSLLYDIVPDKADPNFRIKMFEDKQRRDSAARTKADETAREKAAYEAQMNQIQDFVAGVDAAARTFEAGSYPESEAWFGEDRTSYTQSLVATAKNLAATATAENRVADLSPGALAAALEAETARRMADRDQRRQARKPSAPVAAATAARALAAVGGMQSAETASTKNMNGSGAPQPPAKDERERVSRAIQAGWRQR